MTLDLKRFYQACNPSPLDMGNAEERKYYIDFSSVRGGNIIKELGRTIARLSPDKPTCQLFTGHIGCGKSTELQRLKAELGQVKEAIAPSATISAPRSSYCGGREIEQLANVRSLLEATSNESAIALSATELVLQL